MENQETIRTDVDNTIINKNSKMPLILFSVLVVLAVAVGAVVFLINNIFSNKTVEIDKANQEIENLLSNISDNNDFKDILDVNFNLSEGTSQPAEILIDESQTEIDTMLNDINNSTDFTDIGTLNYNE